MILDKLENSDGYLRLHRNFEKAFEFLRRADLGSLNVATHPVDGKEVYALIQNNSGKDIKDARLEAHRVYIDIQFLVDGNEKIGWKSRQDCRNVALAYSSEKDIEFFSDSPQTYLTMKPGTFAIFFPGDAHAPMISDGNVRKCVVKVRAA